MNRSLTKQEVRQMFEAEDKVKADRIEREIEHERAAKKAICALCFKPLNGEKVTHSTCGARENMLAEVEQ